MNPRELVILLLGLAIIAVILRGLYVALRARRNQIRLAIDKHIPRDIDLEALELSELPSGGARVVRRGSDPEGPAPGATGLAGQAALGEEDDEQVPVLMDAVAIGNLRRQPTAKSPARQSSAARRSSRQQAEDEHPDDVLLDYQTEQEEPEDEAGEDWLSRQPTDPGVGGLSRNGLAEVAPDYPDEDGADFPEDDASAGFADGAEPATDELMEEENFDPALGDFSMTAGDRIGYDEAGSVRPEQSGLFEQHKGAENSVNKRKRSPAAKAEKGAGKSLLGSLGRRNKNRATPEKERPAEKVSEIKPETRPQAATESQPSEVIVINVMAKEGREFAGDDLMQVLITAGLKFGDMNIFHLRQGNDNRGAIIFSVANILNPGTFDLNNMDNFSTLGVSLFISLPTPINNLDAFEQMLAVAQQLRGALDGELKDDHRNVMTVQTIEHYRERIREFELRQLKAAGSRG